jgi:hypothetical protein
MAFGVQRALHRPDHALGTVPAVALCGGIAIYLLGQIAFQYRSTRYLFRRRTIGAAVLLVLIPAAPGAGASVLP